MHKIHDVNWNAGTVARQGDVVLYRLPDDMAVNTANKIDPQNGRIILLEGEMTGHHHAIDVMDRPVDKAVQKTNKAVEDLLANAAKVTKAVVNFYNDSNVPQEMVKRKILARTDLYIGTLSVEGGGDVGVVLGHEEHDGIRLTAGNYYVGRQIESAGAEERRVRD